ncbi:MAG: response regulator transcription factor [Spirochaetales bacterium]|nr:response regulator transcription factor [Spirochaetales bacterium]
MEKILVLEDNEAIRESIENYLKLCDYDVVSCGSVSEAAASLEENTPDLAILDISLPDGNGLFFAREHLVDSRTPFLFLTSQGDESGRITGLEIGAVDYVVKPFSLKELTLRIKAILKRSNPDSLTASRQNRWKLDGDVMEFSETLHKMKINGRGIHLTTMEWEIMSSLIHHEGSILSRKQIQKQLHFLSSELSPRTIDSHIKNIRNKLGNPGWILAVRSFGFRFAGDRHSV